MIDIDFNIFNNISYGSYSPDGIYSCLDKLIFTTTSSIKTQSFDIKSCSKGYGYVFEYRGIKVWFITRDNETNFSINPSFFDSFQSLISFLDQVFIDDHYRYGRVNRLDCTVTLPIDFEEFFPCFDFGRKRVLESRYEESRYGGFYVGRKVRRYSINLYDKQRKSELLFHCTRIEINSIPVVEDEEYLTVELLRAVCNHEPLKSIRLYNISLIEPQSCSLGIRDRYIYFKTRHQREGFWWTRRCINRDTNKNFDALYGSFFYKEP